MRYLILLFAVGFSGAVGAADCRTYVKGHSKWELKIKGKIEPRLTIHDTTDWDPSSQHQGFLLLKSAKAKKTALEVNYVSADGKKKASAVARKLAPLKGHPTYLKFVDFDPRKFFVFDQPGKYTLRLKGGDGKVLCTTEHAYNLGD